MRKDKKIKQLTYRSATTWDEATRMMKAVLIPIAVFLLGLYTINTYSSYGSKLLAPMITMMMMVGAICALILPSHRQNILRETITTTAAYMVTMITLKFILSMLSNVSTASLMTAFDKAIWTSGNTAISWINNMLYITTVVLPFGFVGMQLQRVYRLRRNISKTKMFDRLRGIRDTNRNMQ